MSHLRVIDPVAVESLDDAFRRFFRGARLPDNPPPAQIKGDIVGADNDNVVRTEMPGV